MEHEFSTETQTVEGQSLCKMLRLERGREDFVEAMREEMIQIII